MLHSQLRHTAAWFTLDLVKASDLVDIAHSNLDQSVYADGFAAIVSVRNLPHEEAAFHFAAALRSLGIAFAIQDDAVRYLRLGYFGPVAEGTDDPRSGLSRHYHDLDSLENYGSLAALTAWNEPSAQDLTDHLFDRELRWSPSNVQLQGIPPAQLEEHWKEHAVELCREWCREYARLYLQPAWRSPTVLALASGIRADSAFDRLPILADALEEAGCDHPDILAHCRGDTYHADYCWVIDAILATENDRT